MARIADIVARMRRNPRDIRFTDLCKVCQHYFGTARQQSGSHRVYQTPWLGDPRVNIQNNRGKARHYQVLQVLKAVERLKAEDDTQE